MAMAAKRKRESWVYKFFKHHDGYLICEFENDGGSSCEAKISVNRG